MTKIATHQITVDFFDGHISGLLCFKVNEPVAFRCASLILSDFAAQDRSECRECIVHGLVVNRFVQVLDEDIANARFTERWIALRPHDADGTALDDIEIHGVENTFGYGKRYGDYLTVVTFTQSTAC